MRHENVAPTLRPLLAGICPPPRFENVSCSHCGQDFGPGDHGFSHCENHAHLTPVCCKNPDLKWIEQPGEAADGTRFLRGECRNCWMTLEKEI